MALIMNARVWVKWLEEETLSIYTASIAARIKEKSVMIDEFPKETADAWFEMERGEFFCGGEEDGELEMQGIEIRPCNNRN